MRTFAHVCTSANVANVRRRVRTYARLAGVHKYLTCTCANVCQIGIFNPEEGRFADVKTLAVVHTFAQLRVRGPYLVEIPRKNLPLGGRFSGNSTKLADV